MKNKTIKINNKGAALVSIMITIAFVSIVATTLLMISFNNYQMKVTSAQSKNNFYEAEQNLNIVTAKVRNAIKTPGVSDSVAAVKAAVGNDSDTGVLTFASDPVKVAQLIYPSSTPVLENGAQKVEVVRADNGKMDSFYITSGNIVTSDEGNGKKIVIKDVSVTQKSYDGYENNIKTDITFYVEQTSAGGQAGGVGECSFLMDNCVTFSADGGDGITNTNVYGNSIFGKYDFKTDHSEPHRMTVTAGKLNLSGNDANIYLVNKQVVNFIADYTVVMGDIFLDGNSVMNLSCGNFSCFGNIYIKGSAAFISNGNLKLGPNSKIYSVSDAGVLTELTNATYKNNNVIISGTVKTLTAADYDKVCKQLKLDDNVASNDGVMPNILKSLDSEGKYYCYDSINMQNNLLNDISIFNVKYNVAVPEENIQSICDHKLLLLTNNKSCTIKQETPYSTIIGINPVKLQNAHTINLTQLGDYEFKYLLSYTGQSIYEFKVQNSNGSKSFYNVKIGDFFDTNCNTFVSNIFSYAVGNSGGTPSIGKTAVTYDKWIKE